MKMKLLGNNQEQTARNIIERFMPVAFIGRGNNAKAKDCALIAVDILIETDFGCGDYWENVKSKIKEL